MRIELLSWAPEYGLQIDDGIAQTTEPSAPVDWNVEDRPWAPITPAPTPLPTVQIIDGVRRVDAAAVALTDSGARISALFGSFAVGAVRCLHADTRVMAEHTVVGRRYIQASGDPATRTLTYGGATLAFEGQIARNQTDANGLVGSLQQEMLDAESKLAEHLAADATAITFVDGPLHLRSPGRRVLGYIKRVSNWYLAAEQQTVLPRLEVGQRTPLFRIPAAPGSRERTSWFVRVAVLGVGYNHAAAVMRVEAPAELPPHEAAMLADYSAAILPRLASSPVRDPRAPQNLTPVGGLERALTHRLGDRRLIHRALAAQLAQEAS